MLTYWAREGFNPRPSFLAGETVGLEIRVLDYYVSIHARHFWRAKPDNPWFTTELEQVSIHARHFWRAKHLLQLPPGVGIVVSIHARHFWRAKPTRATVNGGLSLFQSTPVISGGRNTLTASLTGGVYVFQSTPVISGGRNASCRSSCCRSCRFNPRPSFLAGETVHEALS